MPTRTSKRKTRHGGDRKEENSPRCSSSRLEIETNGLPEEQVNEISLRIENELTRKMRHEIRKSENNILKALNSFPENSIRNDHNGQSTEIT